MSATLTMTDQWSDGKRMFVLGSIVFTSTYPTGGESLDFTTIGVETSQAPLFMDVQECQGYSAFFTAGTSPSDTANKLQIYTASTAELSASTYPSQITGGQFNFMAIFQQLI